MAAFLTAKLIKKTAIFAKQYGLLQRCLFTMQFNYGLGKMKIYIPHLNVFYYFN